MKDRASCVMCCAVLAAGLAAFGFGSARADIPASAYVQNGLIAQWDGVENAGVGSHDPNAVRISRHLRDNGLRPMDEPSWSVADLFCAAVLFLRDETVYRPGRTYGFLEKPRAISSPVTLRAAFAVLEGKAEAVTVLPADPLSEVQNHPALRDFHAVGTWIFTPDYRDEYTTDRLRWQIWTARREPAR